MEVFAFYGGLHLNSNVDRLYMPRKIGGRSLITIEDYKEVAVRGLEVYIHGNEERLIHPASGDKLERKIRNSNCFEESEEREEITRLGGEALHGQYFRKTNKVRS